MYCKNCGKEIDGKFCGNCGANNEITEVPNVDNVKPFSNTQISNNNDLKNTSNNENKPKQPIFKKWWFWVIIVVVIIAIGASSNSSEKDATNDKPAISQNDTPKKEDKPKEDAPKEDLSSVATEYTLTAGHYVAGVDIPVGVCDVVAISGNGNLSSSNILNGGVNEVFGVDDGSGIYTSSFNGLKLPKGATLSTNGKLVIKLTFKEIKSNFKGRTYDENNAITLNSGNYKAGTDFPAGVYKIVAVSGSGNLSSSNIYDGGVNEVFGVYSQIELYNNQFLNAELKQDATLKVSGGLSVKLIPAKNN